LETGSHRGKGALLGYKLFLGMWRREKNGSMGAKGECILRRGHMQMNGWKNKTKRQGSGIKISRKFNRLDLVK